MADTLPTGPIKVTTTQRTYFTCPHCEQHRFSLVDSHRNGSFKWGCDVCSTDWNIVIGDSLSDVTLSVNAKPTMGAKTIHGYTLLKYRGGGRPQFIVVDGMDHYREGEDEMDRRHNREYYYNEHTCPTNFLNVEHITFNGDYDPHGIYAFVRFVSNEDIRKAKNWTWAQFKDGISRAQTDFWAELFPEMNKISESDEPCTYYSWDEIEDAVILEADPSSPKQLILENGTLKFTDAEIAAAGESAAKAFDRLKDTVKMFGSPTPLDFSPRIKDFTRKN